MLTETRMGDYFPELTSRRGEFITWISTLFVAGAWLVLELSGQPVSIAIKMMTIFLSLIALSISLGNWMDRRTVISISGDGIAYRNGLRAVHLDWDQISQVHVIPSPWGKKVHVVGDNKHFYFRTLGKVFVQGEIKGRLGFTQGENILQIILNHCKLHLQPSTGGEYYARQ